MIGVFDSGSGGLTVLKAIRERMPSADILYFGDIKNAPYGPRSHAELSQLTIKALQRLRDGGATSIVSACNSVSTSLAISLFDTLEIAPERLIEMVGPTARYFRHADARILLVATQATVESGIYQNAFEMLGKSIQTLAIPELAGAIEFGKADDQIECIIRDSLASVRRGSFDVLILGCTHYPLVLKVFERVLGEGVLIFDPAHAVAERIAEMWWPQEVGQGNIHFLISKDSTPFRKFAAAIMGAAAYTIEVIE
jgi:glutamate racemase